MDRCTADWVRLVPLHHSRSLEQLHIQVSEMWLEHHEEYMVSYRHVFTKCPRLKLLNVLLRSSEPGTLANVRVQFARLQLSTQNLSVEVIVRAR